MNVTYPSLLQTHPSPSFHVLFKSSGARKPALSVRHAPSLAARQDFRGRSQEPGQQLNVKSPTERERTQSTHNTSPSSEGMSSEVRHSQD